VCWDGSQSRGYSASRTLLFVYDLDLLVNHLARSRRPSKAALFGHFFKLLTEQIHSPGIQVAPERHNPQTKRVDTRLIEIDSELSASEPRVCCPANYYLFTTSICLSITRRYTDRS